MPDDQLSTVLELVDVRGVLTGGLAATGDWTSRAAVEDPLKLFAIVSGRIRLTAEGSSRRSSSSRATSRS